MRLIVYSVNRLNKSTIKQLNKTKNELIQRLPIIRHYSGKSN